PVQAAPTLSTCAGYSARHSTCSLSFFFTAHAPPTIYTLCLHDALPIYSRCAGTEPGCRSLCTGEFTACRIFSRESASISGEKILDRKSTRLNSSHLGISYAVFCLKKKKIYTYPQLRLKPYPRTPTLQGS